MENDVTTLPSRAGKFTRNQLLAIRDDCTVTLPARIRWRIDGAILGLHNWSKRRRGRRGGRKRQRDIAITVPCRRSRNRPSPPAPPHRPALIAPRLQRHVCPAVRCLKGGLLNIRSLNNKIENIPDLFDEHELNFLALTESWHEDSDSVPIRRLRSMGYNVVEAARVIPGSTRLDTVRHINHGGIALLSKSGIHLSKIDTKMATTTFEHLCCRVGGGFSPFLLAVIYRPGSTAITDQFYIEFTQLLESLTTYQCSIVVAGDVNIHLERTLDPDCQKFCRLTESFNLRQLVEEPTHERGGILDIVLTSDLSCLDKAEVSEAGLSDHRLVHWTLSTACPPPTYTMTRRRKWDGFRIDDFIARLKGTQLCQSIDPARSVTDLADSYSTEITSILDDLAPTVELSLRVRPSRPFYDAECRSARREARRCERLFRKFKGTAEEAKSFTRWRSALKASRGLVRRKGRRYWREALASAKGDSATTWRHLGNVLGKDTSQRRQPSSFSATEYHQFLDNKVAEIRHRTAGVGPPEFSSHGGATMEAFSAPTVEEVVAIVKNAPCKQCQADPLPMWLLKLSIDTVAPFLTTLMATSLRTGEFPGVWKQAVVHPHLKRPGLDQAEPGNFRPVSNLPFLSKLAERMVNNRLVTYMNQNGLMPKNQSAYRRGHSTETAVLRIVNDLIESVASGRMALICLLDLSAAFDTVDHGILVERLERSYGLKGAALAWIRNFLADRSQTVSWMGSTSAPGRVDCGVPQGSVLGPLLFVLYTADISRIIESFGFSMHAYADDVQAYSSCQPSDAGNLQTRAEACIVAVRAWTDRNRLSLNPAKTEFLWLTTPRRQHLIHRSEFHVDGAVVAPSRQLRLLGVLLDETLTFGGHLDNTIRSCYHHLRRIREVRRYLPTSAAIDLVRALVVSRVDYCNSVLFGLPVGQLNRLQSVLNVSARLVFGARWSGHVTPFLRDRLHWLRVPERVEFKRHWLTFRALNDPHCPAYLSELIRRSTTVPRRSLLRSGASNHLVVPPPLKTAGLGDRSFRRGNPASWNLLPMAVTTETSPDRFLQHLKTHLFNVSFPVQRL